MAIVKILSLSVIFARRWIIFINTDITVSFVHN